ncbi:Protein C8orf37-like protein [Trichoplax sp. H2]|uniref:Cilia- and flagella-associated protein 418 n=1 Tax=Trichoplax adhaerens TaxID=10228 RepID=B3RIN7_TRIAD|nr:hypothetical protein TRIADDRAFT_52472 [Trichoplax adhaerens]EDV29751.1 hypothetical protein TRIADDRAFT_52472 [Trichoplax adhaerens]RDD47252.1 Protein C8orf37-like protein [Trichoplax sp. H2]|eukprot:XP_002108953.1 hypothetical protein TRIADDRAFT_52472 [Trichoplax adhaerens]
MADDIDDLLDEVDQKFIQRKPVKFQPNNENAGENRKRFNNNRSVSSTSSRLRDDDELSRMIEDICSVEDESDIEKRRREVNKIAEKKSVTKQQSLDCSKRCYQVYLGGSKSLIGLATISSQRACNQLRCTACDFRVSYYDDYEWHQRSNYIFFRNNMPDFEKIRVNLLRKLGTRAYACQCSWKSIADVVPVDNYTDLKWVCGRHLKL